MGCLRNLVFCGLSFVVACSLSEPTERLQASLPTVPGLKICQGFDAFQGNPQSTMDSAAAFGFRRQICLLEYTQNRTTPDGTYAVPDGIEVFSHNTCSFNTIVYEISGEVSYEASMSATVSYTKGSWLTGHTSASQDYQRVVKATATMHNHYVTSVAQCLTFTENVLRFTPPRLERDFDTAIRKLVDNPRNAPLIEMILEDYGTHYISSADLGGRAILESEFSSSTFSLMDSQHFDWQGAASASFLLFAGDGSQSGSQDEKKAIEFDQARERLRTSFLGGRPPTDGKVSSWMAAVEKYAEPVVIKLTLLSELVVPEMFPDLNADALDTARKALQTGIAAWCISSGGIACDGTTPDPKPPATFVLAKAETSVQASPICSSGLYSTFTGMTARNQADKEKYLIKYWKYQHGGVCIAERPSCTAICTDAFDADVQLISQHVVRKTTKVSCPAGYVVASCQFNEEGSEHEAFPAAFPATDGSGCYCYHYFGADCGAVCVPSSKVHNYEVKTKNGKGKFTVACPESKSLLGCGYKADAGKDAEWWWYVGASSLSTCVCYNYFGGTCYAVCANV